MRMLRIILNGMSLSLVFMFGLTGVTKPASARTATPSWTLTGYLNTPRWAHTATLLTNGKVLVAGGAQSDGCIVPTSTAELYDPDSGTWMNTGSLNIARFNHTATLLPNGQVLVVGGNSGNASVNTAELYDPTTGSWRLTATFNRITESFSATLLPNGKVLALGTSAELFDPTTETWSMTGTPSFGLTHSVLLPNGKVLALSEGSPWDYADLPAALYDPATGRWISAGVSGLFWAPTMTLMRNGKVLVTGLLGANNPTQAEVYDQSTGWSDTGHLNTFRHYGGYTATLLANGQVLVTGGTNYPSFQPVSAEEIYDPSMGTWSPTSRLIMGRTSHTATLLRNGTVLVAGGLEPFSNACRTSVHRSAELYNPGTIPNVNPIDDPEFFVRQHYLDFLNRPADELGLAFWTNQITVCGTDANCIEGKRVHVSGAFFLSIEFQQSGYLVHRMYKAAYGDMPGTPVPLTRQEFLPDSQQVGQGVVVGAPSWEQTLENNKNAFATEFVARSRFTTAFPQGMTSEQFVDALNANAGGALSPGERNQLVSELASGAKTRAQVLRSVAEDADLARNDFNKAFVLMQYFGYLRRNANAPPDSDFTGYNFWLNKLNSSGGNFVNAEMVKAFITAIEYRQRFDSCAGCWDY